MKPDEVYGVETRVDIIKLTSLYIVHMNGFSKKNYKTNSYKGRTGIGM